MHKPTNQPVAKRTLHFSKITRDGDTTTVSMVLKDDTIKTFTILQEHGSYAVNKQTFSSLHEAITEARLALESLYDPLGAKPSQLVKLDNLPAYKPMDIFQDTDNHFRFKIITTGAQGKQERFFNELNSFNEAKTRAIALGTSLTLPKLDVLILEKINGVFQTTTSVIDRKLTASYAISR